MPCRNSRVFIPSLDLVTNDLAGTHSTFPSAAIITGSIAKNESYRRKLATAGPLPTQSNGILEALRTVSSMYDDLDAATVGPLVGIEVGSAKLVNSLPPSA